VNWLPFVVVKGASALCLGSLPPLLVGALLSSMDTEERYYVQLAAVLFVAAVSVVAVVGAVRQYQWGKHLLTLVYAAAGVFWVYAGVGLNAVEGDHGNLPIGIGVFCLLVAVALIVAESGVSARCDTDS